MPDFFEISDHKCCIFGPPCIYNIYIYSSWIISYSLPKRWPVSYQMNENSTRDDQKLWPWDSCMTGHIHYTKSQIKNGKIAWTQCIKVNGKIINDETCLMKELALPFEVSVIFTMLTVSKFILASLFLESTKVEDSSRVKSPGIASYS